MMCLDHQPTQLVYGSRHQLQHKVVHLGVIGAEPIEILASNAAGDNGIQRLHRCRALMPAVQQPDLTEDIARSQYGQGDAVPARSHEADSNPAGLKKHEDVGVVALANQPLTSFKRRAGEQPEHELSTRIRQGGKQPAPSISSFVTVVWHNS